MLTSIYNGAENQCAKDGSTFIFLFDLQNIQFDRNYSLFSPN
jgi:hypothetical protein